MVQRLTLEANPPLPFSAEVKNIWTFTSTPPHALIDSTENCLTLSILTFYLKIHSLLVCSVTYIFCSLPTTNLDCVTSQRSENNTYTEVEAWNQVILRVLARVYEYVCSWSPEAWHGYRAFQTTSLITTFLVKWKITWWRIKRITMTLRVKFVCLVLTHSYPTSCRIIKVK